MVFREFLFRALLGLVRILPAPVFFLIVRGCVRLFYFCHPRAERYALETLAAVYGDMMPLAQKKRLARVSFLALCDGIMGFIHSIGRPQVAIPYFDIEGEDRLKAALAKGHGVVIGIAHSGPFVWMLMRFVAAGYKVHVVAKPPRGEFWRKKFKEACHHTRGLDVILSLPMRQCVADTLAALRRNEIVFMPVDQNYGAAGRVFVPFFGQLAATAPGPAVFAAKSGAPLLLAFAVPSGRDHFAIRFEGPLDLASTGDERADLVENTRRFTAVVEAHIKKYPEQWSWMHRRWKTVPRENEL